MKKLIYFALLLITPFFYAQTKVAKKPERVIIANNEIITMQQLEEYGKEGRIKSMSNGVSEEKRNEFAKKFGDKIGDKEFISLVEIYDIAKPENSSSTPEKIAKKENPEYLLNVNDKAKDFTLKLVDGKELKLSDLKGKVVLVNFWATWCAPCLQEFYDVPEKILEPFKNDNFVFLAISSGEAEKIVTKKVIKLKSDGLNFNYGIDADRKIWNDYATNSIPKNFVIDQNGVVKFTATGNAEGNLDNIATEIKKLLVK